MPSLESETSPDLPGPGSRQGTEHEPGLCERLQPWLRPEYARVLEDLEQLPNKMRIQSRYRSLLWYKTKSIDRLHPPATRVDYLLDTLLDLATGGQMPDLDRDQVRWDVIYRWDKDEEREHGRSWRRFFAKHPDAWEHFSRYREGGE